MTDDMALYVIAGIGFGWVLALIVVFAVAIREDIITDRVVREAHKRFERWLEEGRASDD